ncbi:MAG: efflux RND transporter permease subunit [Phascolarctobacterium sp.]
MDIIKTSLKRPVSVIITAIATFVFGCYSYTQMGMQYRPDIDLPMVTITTTMSGASATVMDNNVTDVLESELTGISGLSTMESSSYQGRAVTTLEFDMEKDVNDAAADVRDKVNIAKMDLPDEADEPIVEKYDTGDSSIMQIAVTGDADYMTKSEYVDKVLKVKLQAVNGVGAIDTAGFREREVRIWLKPEAVNAYGITNEDIAAAINKKHVELPVGSIYLGRNDVDLSFNGEYVSVKEIESLPVYTKDNTVVRLGEIAKVENGFADEENIALLNGERTILVNVKKQSGANEVKICDSVSAYLDELRPNLPEGIGLQVVYTKSDFIFNAIAGVRTDIMLAVLLCSFLMFIFMQTIRTTFVAVITIPVCLVGSFIIMQKLGISINTISMMGISLSVGMVVDAATVVMENIDRHMNNGLKAMEAALVGTQEVAFSVLGGALTTVAVFSPIAFMTGITGRVFYAFGATVILTILLSLVLSMTLTPFLCSRILKKVKPGRFGSYCNRKFTELEEAYRRALTHAVQHRAQTMLVAAGLFVFGLLINTQVGSTFFTTDDQGTFQIECEMPSGTSLEETYRVMNDMGKVVRQHPAVKYTYSEIGNGTGGMKNEGTIYVQMHPSSQRDGLNQVMDELRHQLSGFKDIDMFMTTFAGKDVSMTLVGNDSRQLSEVAEKIIADANATGKLRDLKTDVRFDKPEVDIKLKRGITDLQDVDLRAMSNELYAAFGGKKVGVYKENGYRYDIRLKATDADRMGKEALDNIYIHNGDGSLIQANNVFTAEEVLAPNVVKRYNRQRSVTISGNVTTDYSSGQAMVLFTELAKKHIPQGSEISIVSSGLNKKQVEAFQTLAISLVAAIFLVYVIMAIQFESFVHPFTIMFSLPLLTPGTFGLMYLLNVKLDIMSYMGLILLVGIVVNNGIILVSFINDERQRGLDKVTAVINAGPLRLRAILITALSTLLGSLPAALMLTTGSESRQPMSVAIFGGLLTSTLLTLLVVPVVYLIIDDFTEKYLVKVQNFFGRLMARIE